VTTAIRQRGGAMRVMLAATCVLAASCLCACASDPRLGYSTASTYGNVGSVAVPMFRNQTASAGLEQVLTDSIIKQVQGNTPVRVVQSGQAHSTLRGVITDVQMRRISLDSTTGLVQELALQITVDFEWRDNRTGDVIKARKNFAAADSFVPANPSGERLEIGENAAAQRLARDIVNELRGAW
jgi:hypothetical protein